jgi:hypothetical protein
MKRLLIIYLFLTLAGGCLFSQITGDIETYLSEYVGSIPGSSGNQYRVPTQTELDTWRLVMDEFNQGQFGLVSELLSTLNYELIEFDQQGTDQRKFYVFREKYPLENYWGIYVFSADPEYDNLVLQAPHPRYDTNTGLQAIFCFKRLNPAALFISGTHRCNYSQLSSCSGTTTVCGSSSPYRVSDNAHNTNAVFQILTEELFLQDDGRYFVQLHGFAKLSSDPYLIMSNGTRIAPDPDYIQKIQIELQQIDPVLTFKIAHLHTDWNRLIANTNTQGRYINGSVDACHQNATSSEGRFIHIEQEKSRLRADSTGWYKMYTALKNAFYTDPSETAHLNHTGTNFIYPNPSDGVIVLSGFPGTNLFVSVMDLTGNTLYNELLSPGITRIDVGFLPAGSYLLHLSSQEFSQVKKLILLK